MTKDRPELRIHFGELNAARANVAARELQKHIHLLSRGEIHTTLKKEREDTQDLGTILAIVLGTPAAIAFATHVAAGIGAFVARLGTKVTIETDEGCIVLTGQAPSDSDIAAIVTSLRTHSPGN